MIDSRMEKRSGKCFFIIDKVGDVKGYQYQIMRNNDIQNLLKFDYEYIDNEVSLIADVTDMCSLKEYSEKRKLSAGWISSMFDDLNNLLSSCSEYLLDNSGALLDASMIFVDSKGKCRFVYYPENNSDIKTGIRRLLEFLVGEIDYNDKSAVSMVYGMLSKLDNPEFSVDELLSIEYESEFAFCDKSEEKGDDYYEKNMVAEPFDFRSEESFLELTDKGSENVKKKKKSIFSFITDNAIFKKLFLGA